MQFTGERYLPELDSPDISYEHWHRYLFATPLVKDKVVLDIASGEGYGSSLLARSARQVTGVDADPEAVTSAGVKYQAANLEFRQGTVDGIPISGHEVVDVVVSFETIEHVAENEQVAFAREVKRLLRPGGFFVVSTPNKLIYSDRPGYRNPFHKREFYQGEFLDFLHKFFRKVRLFQQRVYPISYIWPPGSRERAGSEYQLAHANGQFTPTTDDQKEGIYLVALCTDTDVEDLGHSILVDVFDRKTLGFRAQIEEQGSRLESLSSQVEEQQNALEIMSKDLANRNDALADAQARLSQQALQMNEQAERSCVQTAHAARLASKVKRLRRKARRLQQTLALKIQWGERLEALLAARQKDAVSVLAEEFAQLRKELVNRDERLLAVAESLQRSGAAGATMLPSGQTAPKAFEKSDYHQVVQRVRRMVARVVPANAIIAVVSKGDPALLELEGRQGWHFPQQFDGEYAGYYPRDSATALQELDKVRDRGAGYLLFPATALWWLDHYKDFAAHLKARYSVLARDEQTCVIFDLDVKLVAKQGSRRTSPPEDACLARQMRGLVESILPADAKVLVVSTGESHYVELGKRVVSHFPQGSNGEKAGSPPADSAAAITELEEHRGRGAQFLVLPRTASWWFDHYQEFGQHLETNYRTIVRQRHVCQIFDLR